MTIQVIVKTFKPRTVHSVLSLVIFVTTQVMISSLLAWHVYEPLFSSSVTTFLLAFFEIHHLSPCNLSCYLQVALHQLEPRARFIFVSQVMQDL